MWNLVRRKVCTGALVAAMICGLAAPAASEPEDPDQLACTPVVDPSCDIDRPPLPPSCFVSQGNPSMSKSLYNWNPNIWKVNAVAHGWGGCTEAVNLIRVDEIIDGTGTQGADDGEVCEEASNCGATAGDQWFDEAWTYAVDGETVYFYAHVNVKFIAGNPGAGTEAKVGAYTA